MSRKGIRTLFSREARSAATKAEVEQAESRFEVGIAVLLGLAAVATAFAAYKAELADGDSVKAFNEGIRLNDQAGQAATEGNQEFVQDQTLFIEYAKATQQEGNTELATYMKETLMSPKLSKSVEWWAEQGDFETYPTPFTEDNPEYGIEQYVRAEALEKQVEQKFDLAREKDDSGDRYTLITVILAVALFMLGVAGVTRRLQIRFATTGAGAAILALSLALLATA